LYPLAILGSCAASQDSGTRKYGLKGFKKRKILLTNTDRKMLWLNTPPSSPALHCLLTK
jgi:hypothetical protein